MCRSLGKMSVYKLFNWRDSAADTIQQTVQSFLELGEAVATRWIQTRKGVMLLQMVPDNNASGAIYVFDRQRDDWYMLSFEGCEDRFTSELFDRVFSEYKLFSYVDQPGLLLSQMQLATPDLFTLSFTTHRTKSHSQPGGIPCAYPLAASARSRLVRTGRGCRLSRSPHRTQWLRHPPQTRARFQARPAALRPPVLQNPNLVAA